VLRVLRAATRGEVPPEALHPRLATVAVVLLRNEYITRGVHVVPDRVVVEIVDEVYLPLLRGRGENDAQRSGWEATGKGSARSRSSML
jgi:hypothetical protein